MTLTDILNEVRELSKNDKLALIEAAVQMLRRADDENGVQPAEIVAEVAAPYRVDDAVEKTRKWLVQEGKPSPPVHPQTMTLNLAEIDLDDYFCEDTQEAFLAEMQDFLNMPDPEPERMIRFGMFKGRIPVGDEYFKLAEWHPSEEELVGDG